MQGLSASTSWEYRAVLAPTTCSFEYIGQVLDKLGLEGWEYVGCIDREVAMPEAPSDLRGEEYGGRMAQQGNGAVLLAVKNTMMAHHLMFKRPRPPAPDPDALDGEPCDFADLYAEVIKGLPDDAD